MTCTLDEIVKARGKMPVKEALKVFEAMARGVDHCHRSKVAHFDLKPQNILIRLNGATNEIKEVKLSDFGLARSTDERFQSGRDSCGTIIYMSPEMLRLEGTFDERSDVWSLGVILHEMITGTLPFNGNSMRNIILKIKG